MKGPPLSAWLVAMMVLAGGFNQTGLLHCSSVLRLRQLRHAYGTTMRTAVVGEGATLRSSLWASDEDAAS
jgi:hypothetical protein